MQNVGILSGSGCILEAACTAQHAKEGCKFAGDGVRQVWAALHHLHGRQGHGEAGAECVQDAIAGR